MQKFVEIQGTVINPGCVATVSWQGDGKDCYLLQIELATGYGHEFTIDNEADIELAVGWLVGDRIRLS
jgi:hypothetical protein